MTSEVDVFETSFDSLEIVKQDSNKHNVPANGSVETKGECDEVNYDDRLVLCQIDEKETKQYKLPVNNESDISLKIINSANIMNAIQLGIRKSMGRLSAEPNRDILMLDFMTVESISFPTEESTINNDFIFKTYAPEAFRYFRGLFGINPECFVSSFCDEPLVELPNPGSSGSLLYLTQNDIFITKSVKPGEAEFLQKLLPGYYMNLNQNPQTLLPKFFGLYCYKRRTRNVRMVVMNNILPSSIIIHKKYDLKGSTYNRTASKEEHQKRLPTFKDLDFVKHHPEGIYLDFDSYRTLLATVERDCRVLESFQIMDYSLLIGVQNIEQAKEELSQTKRINQKSSEGEDTNIGDGNGKEMWQGIKTKEYKLDDFRSVSLNSTLTLKHSTNVFSSGLPARQANGEQLLLFIGIIDILQSYTLRKKLEHVCKSIVHNSASDSVQNPAFYAKRFQTFLSNSVFKPIPPVSKSRKKSTTKLDTCQNY